MPSFCRMAKMYFVAACSLPGGLVVLILIRSWSQILASPVRDVRSQRRLAGRERVRGRRRDLCGEGLRDRVNGREATGTKPRNHVQQQHGHSAETVHEAILFSGSLPAARIGERFAAAEG